MKNLPSSTTSSDDESSAATEKGQRQWSYSVPGVMESGGYFLTALVEYVSELMRGGLTLTQEFSQEVSLFACFLTSFFQ